MRGSELHQAAFAYRRCRDLSSAPVPPGARTVDAGGNAILPGVIDSHVQFCLPGGSEDPLRALSMPATLNLFRIAQRLRITSEHGVTTARPHGPRAGLPEGGGLGVGRWVAPRPTLTLALPAGLLIAVGTDSGTGPAHGNNLRALGLLVDNGMTPMQAIVAAIR